MTNPFTKEASSLPAQAARPAAQSPAIPSTWDKVVDVVVAGASGAGMAAAIEAATAGSNTVIIEKGDHWGGLWLGAGGECTIGGNNHIQQRDGVTGDSLQLWFENEMQAADYRANPEIIRTYVEHGDEFLSWFESLGAVWAKTVQGVYTGPMRGMYLAASTTYPSFPTTVGPNGTFGISWIYLLKKELDSLSVPILLKNRLTSIYREPNGPVVGVAVDTPTGPMNIQTNQAVVIATGGTSDNVHLLHAYDPRYDNDMYHDGAGPLGTPDMVQNTGDGHLAAMAVGAGLTDMSYACYLPIKWGSHLYWLWPSQNPRNYADGTGYVVSQAGVSISDYTHVICVKGDGSRFVNESVASQRIPTVIGIDPYAPFELGQSGAGVSFAEYPEHQFSRAFLNLPDRPRNCWAVTDADGAKALSWNIAEIANPNPSTGLALYPDSVATAQDLPSLAVIMGVDPDGLTATVTKYNGYVDSGTDPDFGTTPKYKIQTAPYYAVKWCVVRHTQRNGIRTNSRCQVIDASASQWNADQGIATQAISIDQEPVIPRLYAAGEVQGSLGFRRLHNTLGAYLIFGRIAGQNASAESSLA